MNGWRFQTTVTVMAMVQFGCGGLSRGHKLPSERPSVLASLGTINPQLDGVGDLQFELKCDSGDVVTGALIGSGENAKVKFKRTASQPISVGSKCRMTAVGSTNAEKYEYLDEPRTSDGKSIYHITSIGTVAADNKLSLTSVKRFNEKGAPLFTVTVKVASSDFALASTAAASLDCDNSTSLAGSYFADKHEFAFPVTSATFQNVESHTCSNVQVTSASKTLKNKTAFSVVLTKDLASFDIEIELEVVGSLDDQQVETQILNLLAGTFSDVCAPAAAQTVGDQLYRRVRFEIALAQGENKGTMKKFITLYTDQSCTTLAANGEGLADYDVEVLDPSLVHLPDTLPIALYRKIGNDRTFETNTIVMATTNKIQFGAAVSGSGVWTGSPVINNLPTTLNLIDYARQQ